MRFFVLYLLRQTNNSIMKGFKITYRGITKQIGIAQGKVNLLATLMQDRPRFTAVTRDRSTKQVATHTDFIFKPGESVEITYCKLDSPSTPLITTAGDSDSPITKLEEFRQLEKILKQKGAI